MQFNRIGVAIAAALAFSACTDRGVTGPELKGAREEGVLKVPPAYSFQNPHLDYPPPSNVCGTASVADLRVGSTVIGTITVVNEQSKLFVTYKTNSPYFISNTRLEVARQLHDVPRFSSGRANPWAFDYANDQAPAITEWYYTVNYSDWNLRAGDEVLLAVMAGVVYPTTPDWSASWAWKQAWVKGTRIHPDYDREQYITYKLQPCGTTEPPPPPPPVTGGFATLTFDDGWETTYTNALPVLNEFGLRGNVAINSLPIDEQWVGYMNITQVRALHAAGWSIINHTVTHRDLTTLSDAEVHAEIRNNRAWIEANGFRGANVFVVPFHRWGDRELAIVRQYASHARGYSVNQFNPARYESYPAADPYGLTGYEPEFAPYTTAEGREQVRAIVEYAVRNNKFVDIFFHRIPAANVPAFRELMSMLAQYRANIKPYHELFPATVMAGN